MAILGISGRRRLLEIMQQREDERHQRKLKAISRMWAQLQCDCAHDSIVVIINKRYQAVRICELCMATNPGNPQTSPQTSPYPTQSTDRIGPNGAS